MYKKITKICPICKKEYLGTKIQKFCSNSCSAKSPNHYKVYNDKKAVKKSYESIKKHYLNKYGKNYEFGKVKRTCQICNKEIETYYKDKKTCSRKCWSEYLIIYPNLPENKGQFGFKKGNTYWRTNGNSKYKKGWIKLGTNKYWYDSSFEKIAMQLMYKNAIKFEKDYKVNLSSGIYFVDFYLPKYKLFIESKGYLREDAKRKIREFKKRISSNFVLIQAQYPQDFEIKFKKLLEVL